jgi:hypothetical protein
MCDLQPLYAVLLATEVALILALVFGGAALLANLGFFTSFTAPIPFAVSYAAVIAAGLGFLGLTLALNGCGSTACMSQQVSAVSLFAAVAVSIGIAITIGAVAMLISGLYGIGAGAIGFYLAAVIAAAATLPVATQALQVLQACSAQPVPPLAGAVVVLGVFAAFLGVAGGVVVALISPRAPNKPTG